MYLTDLRLRNVKLFREVDLAFRGNDDSARMWTVVTGVNGLCKSTLLQAIALAASGPKVARALVDDARDYVRGEGTGGCMIAAGFERAVDAPPIESAGATIDRKRLDSVLELHSTDYDFAGHGEDWRHIDALRSARASGFLVAGIGVGRTLPQPGEVAAPKDPIEDRVVGLFRSGHKMVGTEFYNALKLDGLEQDFAKSLRSVLLRLQSTEDGRAPLLTGLCVDDLRGPNGLDAMRNLLETRRFEMSLGETRFRVKPTMLSHGYQGVLSWIGDLLGYAFLEQRRPIEPQELRGIVLLDEIDQQPLGARSAPCRSAQEMLLLRASPRAWQRCGRAFSAQGRGASRSDRRSETDRLLVARL
ncbi:MAG: hypothetical protein AAF628_32410 [Planctomycetota bacterium]